MWRQCTFPGRRDSDQSISDDDEEFEHVTYDHDCLENLRSLHERGKKDQLQVASQLEILEEKLLHSTGGHELNFGGRTSTSLEMLESSHSKEDEMHEFQNEDRSLDKYHPRNVFSTVSDDETISDEEKETGVPSNSSCNPAVSKFRGSLLHNFESESQCGTSKWSEVLKEANELVYLHEYGSSSSHAVISEARKFHKAIGRKTKLKFSIHPRSCNEALSWPPVVNDETTKSSEVTGVPAVLEALGNRITEYSRAELLEDLQDENEKLSNSPRVPGESVALVHRGTEHSMSELLEGLQEKKGQLEGTSSSRMNTTKTERRFQLARKRILFPAGDRVLDDEDPLETMDCGMSSEDEENCQNQSTLATSKVKWQTMADRFQEAFREAALVDQRTLFPTSEQTGIGYYGRLQLVMQKEKERNIELLKHFQTGGDAEDESGCFDVQILSRYLDANLTVCHCSFGDKSKISPSTKSLEKLEGSGKKWKGKIIFTTRICGNVELEVGNLIRIYPPWREVQVMEDETIILCTYFSQISTRF